jgi:hypothetical protein
MRNLERWHPLPNRSGAGFVLGMTLWVIPFFFRGEDGRTDGIAHHARGLYCGGAMDGWATLCAAHS